LVDKDNKFYIDIGSSFEYNLSRQRIFDSSRTIFFECDPQKVANFRSSDPVGTANLPNFILVDDKATPDNIVEHIQNATDNPNPKLVDLDIDGYDYYVLEAILEAGILPSLILAEINEKIPPPIKFTVKYWSEYWFTEQNITGTTNDSHFYGMSLSKFYELANKYGYDVINLTFNNVYAVRRDKNPGLKAFEASELYDTFYKNLRLSGAAPMFDYNANMDPLLTLSPEEGINFLRFHYESRGKRGFYDLCL